jgi:hypothetical protein
MSKPTKPEIIATDMEELAALLQRAEGTLAASDYQLLRALVESYAYVTDLLEDKKTSISRLRALVFGAATEKTAQVVAAHEAPSSPPATELTHEGGVATETNTRQDQSDQDGDDHDDRGPSAESPASSASQSAPRKGHGRNGADAYQGGETRQISHPSLQSGAACPTCLNGTVYELDPGVIVRILARAPLFSRTYALQKLRCNLCGASFTAPSPADVGAEKYDATAASMIGILKYRAGVPFHRLEGLQGNLGIPLPASTQWDVVSQAEPALCPVYQELIRQAAQGEVLHHDDTMHKILEMMGQRARKNALAQRQDPPADAASSEESLAASRTGIFTSGVVSIHNGRRIALFFTGRRHAGENLVEVLKQRAAGLGLPIQMCDALSRNMPDELRTILANCLAHGRRKFVEVFSRFPQSCLQVLEAIKAVYQVDAEAREQQLSPLARLELHQARSKPVMDELHEWLRQRFEQHLVEPNSALGKAIQYLLNHWEPLTLFLRQAGAPLDNNVCERALKIVIRHRKNSLFYRSQRGARVGDVFMSLIHTCQLCSANALAYLTALQEHAAAVALQPADWLPWNYQAALAAIPVRTSALAPAI